jgi:hypothetical protein
MTDRTTDPTLRELLDAHSEAFFAKFHAPIQARVQVYSTSPAIVDAVPLVILPVEGTPGVKPLVMRQVPVAFPGGSVAGYTYPLTPGVDTVSLMPQDADLDRYVASGSVFQQPGSKRRFDLSDAIAIPNNLRAGGQPLPSTAFAPDGGVLWGLHYLGGSDATDFVAMAAKVLTQLASIVDQHNLHVHANHGVTPTVPMTDPASVAATLAKVK